MELEFDLSQLEDFIQERIKKAENLDLLKSDLAIVIDEDIRDNFEDETSPDGQPWEDWSKSTYVSRDKMNKLEGKKLQQDRDLYKSLDSEIKDWGVRYGAIRGGGVKYARIHQLGGYAGRNRKVKIPARPYLGYSNKLKEKIILVVKEHS